ncbi:transposase [Chloroflexi bacterium TSY]|nr:transposase [Chloroflexi bacterium TSY]MBV7339964.1 transposase [Chloroflexi bacterium TSY]
MLVKMVERLPWPEAPLKRGRGRPKVYSDCLMVKALIIMIVRRLYTAYSLLAFLEQETELTCQLRLLLCENGKFPTRRTWERRLTVLPDSLPGLIGVLGRHLVQQLQPWAKQGRAVSIDSTPLRAKGGVWHKKDREKGVVPHSTIDTEAHWSKSGYHGWWSGWKLHLASTATALWIPLAAELTPANHADIKVAPSLLPELPFETRYLLGDTHYNEPEFRALCHRQNIELVATRYGPYPHSDPGVKVRQLFHRLRSKSIEPFNNLFKNIFDWQGQVPVKGLTSTRLFVLGALLLYQIVLLYQFERNLPLGKNIKPLLRAA